MIGTPEKTIENYHALLDPTGPLRSAHNVIKFLQSARYSLSLRGIAGWPKAEVKRLHEALDALNEAVRRAEKKS